MSSVARLYTFTDGTDAYGSQVEAEFSTIFNSWNNHDAGTSTWTAVKATTLTAVTTFNIGSNAFAYTPWTAYTPTFQAFGTVSNIAMRYMIVGNTMFVQGTFQAGTTTSAEPRIGFPSGITASLTSTEICGSWYPNSASTAAGSINTLIAVNGNAYFNLGRGVASSTNPYTVLTTNGSLEDGVLYIVQGYMKAAGF